MLIIFSTPRIFALLLTGVMITSCSGGTSSDTGANNNGGGDTTQAQDQPQPQTQTLTVNIPSLGRNYTIVKGETTEDDIANIAVLERANCEAAFGSIASALATCRAQVNSAAQQARNFINS